LTVTFGWLALNARMAACWKFVWNVEPLALIVPLAEEAPEVEPLAVAEEVLLATGADELDEEELDEEQAARVSTAMTAPPATTACVLPRSCIREFSLIDAHLHAIPV